jgi:transcriptional regulator with XRE-family HTH domain/predicted Fe-Mo cluster-binding NifX family protein
MDNTPGILPPAEILVGRKLRELRTRQGFSLRNLATRSGLNVNTLSLIEKGKSSPSVSTLQQLAQALDVPITTFFESESSEQHIVFTPSNQRPKAAIGSTQMENLGENLAGNLVQPFVVTLEPGMGSGEQMIIHTGHEFVFCLDGTLFYQIDQQEYFLNSGDSLLFEAHLPHCWENKGENTSQILLILYPADKNEEIGGRHFSISTLRKEINLKIAIVTDDGITINQHFGRASNFLVLTIEEGKITNREMRDKVGYLHLQHDLQSAKPHQTETGMDSATRNKHPNIADAISDCKALLCGGMGKGAAESMRQLNIKPVVTDLRDINSAVQAFMDGELIDPAEILH